MNCRSGCGICCIVPSINTALPGMPQGKPAGVSCIHLGEHFKCELFGSEQRPGFCSGLRPSLEMCGATRQDARENLQLLEELTKPSMS